MYQETERIGRSNFQSIGNWAESVNQRLINTNDNISVVTKKDRTCGYWIVITILAIAILVVIFA